MREAFSIVNAKKLEKRAMPHDNTRTTRAAVGVSSVVVVSKMRDKPALVDRVQ